MVEKLHSFAATYSPFLFIIAYIFKFAAANEAKLICVCRVRMWLFVTACCLAHAQIRCTMRFMHILLRYARVGLQKLCLFSNEIHFMYKTTSNRMRGVHTYSCI